MKALILIALLVSVYTYDRGAALSYAQTYWNDLNHDCYSEYYECTPYSYWGSEHCGYPSQGGDCANFVSQCVLAGGHPALVGGECRGYPCGVEEIGATKLGLCLADTFGWKRDCGYMLEPPSDVQAGDVLIYHADSCSSYDSHAVFVISGGPDAEIACHSNMQYGAHYTYITSMPYYEWLRYPGGSPPSPDPDPDPEPDPEPPTSTEKLVKVITSDGINRRSGPGNDYDIVGSYYYGDIIQVVEKTGDWYKDVDGYYLTAIADWVADVYGTVTSEIGLNVREAPSTSAAIVDALNWGAKVQCLKYSDGWYYITSGGIQGWVTGEYLAV